jgi:hypothetical protein
MEDMNSRCRRRSIQADACRNREEVRQEGDRRQRVYRDRINVYLLNRGDVIENNRAVGTGTIGSNRLLRLILRNFNRSGFLAAIVTDFLIGK